MPESKNTGNDAAKLVRRAKPASRAAKAAALRRGAVFSGLGEADLEVIAGSSRLYAYGAGERIFARGEPSDALFVVESGTVRMLGDGEAGAEVIAELVAGEAFGELDLLASSPRSATAVAATDCRLLRLPGMGGSFRTALGRHAEVSARLLFSALRVIAGRIRRANALVKENSPWIQEARRQVYGDKLTGLSNKTFFEEEVANRSGRGEEFGILMFKPDNFKLINDSCGHEAGDAVLKLMAVEVRRQLGEGEMAARYMGNELAVILPGADRGACRHRAETLRAALGALDLSPAVGERDIHLSTSYGAAVAPEHGRAAEPLIGAAHALPLVGRERGGNRILFPEDAT